MILPNFRHELFAQAIVGGLSPTKAYISAGYNERGAAQSAARLLRNAKVCCRLQELQAEISRALVKLTIKDRNARLLALQDRWERMRRVIEQRAADPENLKAAGGDTGLIVITNYKPETHLEPDGEGGLVKLTRQVPEFAVDTALLRELRDLEKQAAQELGQWVEKQDVTGRVEVATVSVSLSQAFSLQELEQMKARLLAAQAKQLPTPAESAALEVVEEERIAER